MSSKVKKKPAYLDSGIGIQAYWNIPDMPAEDLLAYCYARMSLFVVYDRNIRDFTKIQDRSERYGGHLDRKTVSRLDLHTAVDTYRS